MKYAINATEAAETSRRGLGGESLSKGSLDLHGIEWVGAWKSFRRISVSLGFQTGRVKKFYRKISRRRHTDRKRTTGSGDSIDSRV